jgi:hypothetical protein
MIPLRKREDSRFFMQNIPYEDTFADGLQQAA